MIIELFSFSILQCADCVIQAAVKKRCRRHLAETDEFASSTNGGSITDPLIIPIAYQKMKSLISSVRDEICTDIEIYSKDVLPRYNNLLLSSVYSELYIYNHLSLLFLENIYSFICCIPLGSLHSYDNLFFFSSLI